MKERIIVMFHAKQRLSEKKLLFGFHFVAKEREISANNIILNDF
jgi:hypothetical protein